MDSPHASMLKKTTQKNKAQLTPRAWAKISLTLLKVNIP